ncbi:GbsR/MarR family transcriptional regulator [Lysobacter capsici]|uniref:GbsR/MarR family transcriptional regulator n=1 Tax=Lysobacter capsici TaxID=435897 RepID=UPI0009E4F50A|nr:GbsR/MarR family transcriptional regulator [Lysobacter capsici]
MSLSPLQERFILHWGEMGSRWGVNRTVAQIHALLFLSERAITADEICETLNLARSNVSTSLKELQSWNLARVTHVLGDRRDHFETYKDVWDIFRAVVQERRRREIEPTLSMLRTAVLDGANAEVAPDQNDPRDQRTLARMREVLEFMETGTSWIDEMNRLDPKTLIKLLKMGARIQQYVRGPVKPLPAPQAAAGYGVLFEDELEPDAHDDTQTDSPGDRPS